ncbi:MAG: histidine phosphatase family protein [Rhodobacteraceae bacterium]|nr:histidine phosphatase family protein [Paracoccaceae bacterium]
MTGGRLCGRTDVAADLTDGARLEAVRTALAPPARLIISPAMRCRQTAGALWPDHPGTHDPLLWEQDFGLWEGQPYADLPDLGPLAASDLAAHCPPKGESFADLCARIGPALQAIAAEGPATIVAHAGTARAALALAFDIAPLSATRLLALPGGGWSIRCVNWTPAP